MTENISEFVELTGLSCLKLTREQYLDLLHDLLTQLYGSPTTRTSVETVIKRYNRHKDSINEMIANRLVFMFEELAPEQLDFVVLNVRDSSLAVAPRIYHQLAREGMRDLTEILRIKWFNAWISRKYRLPPLTCPICGFNALMPDLTCIVCGAAVSESLLRKTVDFEKTLLRFLEELQCDDLKNLLNYDTLLLNSEGLKHPASARTPVDIEIYLSAGEKKLMRETYIKRCRSSRDEGIK